MKYHPGLQMEFCSQYVTETNCTTKRIRFRLRTQTIISRVEFENLQPYLKPNYTKRQKRSLSTYEENVKKTWNALNTLLYRNKNYKAYPDRINTGDKVITNTQDMVNYFNSFFSSIGPKLATTIRQTPAHDYKEYLTRIINSSFSFKENYSRKCH